MNAVARSPSPFFWTGGPIGLLILHGFAGTPSEMRPMGTFFHRLGYTVHAPLLPGHGETPEALRRTRWTDWVDGARAAYLRLAEAAPGGVVVAGLSMGGAIALLIARELAPRAAVVLAAPLRFRDRRAYLAPLVHRFYPYRPREGKKPPHIEAHLVPYDRIPVRSVVELWRLLRVVRRELPDVRVPLFIAQGLRDETIFPQDAERIFRRAGTPPAKKALVWYPEASHLIVLEREKETLFRDIARFLHTHVPGAPAPPESGGAPV
ncbi:alpha/beta fold hydrolase [Hydrogenibacillus sp. N12]|uniref:alpha/beta hydrolase n=1 Tax=Hydrogenibacillus sp. N12 TaxID=2866627 RepID=UPI001C7D4778|nr:alpha/beta fold hydrolase [Hydrogenibacillus sp. N12]QZA32754.1 alpha/beta fold hydrolase [Hydrogenibacillus sp. N12]